MINDIEITAIIPVRSGSTRCKNKNTRIIGDTSLLKKKIKILKEVPNIKYIIVSTSDDFIIESLKNEHIQIHKRDHIYSQTDTTGKELFKCLSDAIITKHMMYVTCVTPFVSKEHYIKAISLYNNFQITNEYDSVISCGNIKDFLWKDNKSLNYDSFNAQPSQFLPDIYNLTFAFNIISTEYVQNNHSIIGTSPYFYELDQISAIDIDTEFDFLITELLYKHSFNSIKNITQYLALPEKKDIILLDCTLRDGGFLNKWNYDLNKIIEYYNIISQVGIDFFECGFIYNKPDITNGICWSLETDVFQKLKNTIKNGSKLAAMILVENTNQIINKIEDLDMIRILVNLKNTKITKDIIDKIINLHKLGYIITINIAYIDIIDEEDILELITILNPIADIITCIYIADTFGSITQFDLLKYIRQFNLSFKEIGFHGHNNLNLAISNTLLAIDSGVKYIDCTISGIGRGGGNTPTELLLIHLNEKHNKRYNIISLLEYLNSKINNEDKLKILYTLSGLKKIHPNLVSDIFNNSNNNLKISFQKLINL